MYMKKILVWKCVFKLNKPLAKYIPFDAENITCMVLVDWERISIKYKSITPFEHVNTAVESCLFKV